MPSSEIDFPGRSETRREARIRQRSFYKKQKPPEKHNLGQENWQKADPDEYYIVSGEIVKGSEFAERILTINARETNPPPLVEKIKIELRLIQKKLFG